MHGQRIGYIRVSTLDQHTQRQLDGIELDKTFTDKASGKDTKRPQLELLMSFVRSSDAVFVHSSSGRRQNLYRCAPAIDKRDALRPKSAFPPPMPKVRTDASARAVFFLNMNDRMRKASHAETQVRLQAAMGAASTGKNKGWYRNCL